MRAISWSELVTLMVHGPDLPTRGRLHHVEVDGRDSVPWARVGGTPVPPPFASGVEVTMWGSRLRLVDADGRLTMLTDGTTAWSFNPETPDVPPRESPLDHVEFGVAGSDVLIRTTARTWLDHVGQRPPEPTPTTHAGRAAWAVDLSPPFLSGRAVQIVVDAETGMLLQQRDDDRARLTEWSEITVGADIDPEAFTWDGPVVTWAEQLLETRSNGERQQAAWEERHERWTREQLGLTRVTITLDADLLVRDLLGDGTLSASLGDMGSLDRRPRSDAPWSGVDQDELDGQDGQDGELVEQWSDDRWDWAVRIWGGRLADGALEALREQLERGGPAG